MDIKNFTVKKYLIGCFYDSDFSYKQSKGNFLNKAKAIFRSNKLVYLEHQDLGDILIGDKNKFQIRLTDSTLHFEGVFTKEEFLKFSHELFTLHENIFPDTILNKMGFVVYFEKNESKSDNLFKKYFSNIDISEVGNLNFRLNYSETINSTKYNINLSLRKDELSQNVNGEIDFNLSKSDNNILTNESIDNIFNDLYDYYKNTLFVKIGL